MKKEVMMLALMCLVMVKGNAQTYGYDDYVRFPTMDLYDPGTMNMAIRAQAEMAARRQQYMEFCANQAIEAKRDGRWNDVIKYCNNALESGGYDIFYFFRGTAYEELGYNKYALADYKRAKRAGISEAANLYDALKAKMKEMKKKK